jgi:hypothetical protein
MLFSFYHLFKYSFLSFATFFITFIIIALTVIVLFETYELTSQVDWSYPIELAIPSFQATPQF